MIRKFFFYLPMGLLALMFVAPLAFMIVSSFKPDAQIFADLPTVRAFLPVGDISLDNYRVVLHRSPLLLYLTNSTVISVITVVLGVLVNSMAAFGLQRVRWPGQQFVLALILALLIVPFEVLAIPLMMIVAKLPWLSLGHGGITIIGSWFNSLHVQIIPFIGNAFCIFLFYQFFKDLPTDLDDAARGCGATPAARQTG